MTEPKAPVASLPRPPISAEDFDAYKGKMDKKIDGLEKRVKGLDEELGTKDTELALLKASGDDPEATEAMRKEHVKLTGEHRKTLKELEDTKAELTKREVGTTRSKIATDYKFKELGIDETILAECETESEMELVAAKAKIAKLEKEPEPPPKGKFDLDKGAGAGGEDVSKLSARQAFRAYLEDKESEGK